MARKRKTYLTEDMKRKVAREYSAAARGARAEIAERYGVSTGSVCRWIRDGLANGDKPAKVDPAPQIGLLLDLYDDEALDREGLERALVRVARGGR